MTDAADPRAERNRRQAERAAVTAERQRKGRNVWWRRGIRIVRRKIGGGLIWLLAPTVLRALSWSWRIEKRNFAHFENAHAAEGGFLIAIWHGDMLAPLPLHTKRGTGVLVSPSGDGALVKMILQRFGYQVIRGSTNRGSARALREMREHLEACSSVAITPDGPRGPRHSMNLGLAWLARETGSPIVCVRVTCDRAWELSSWDRFRIPKPRAKVTVEYAPPVVVTADCDDAALESHTRRIQELLG